MKALPRAEMVPVENSAAHPNLTQTLVLLKIDAVAGPIYFVVEGLADCTESAEALDEHSRYFYEEPTCPTNFIRIPMISTGGDHDPHGVFEFVAQEWMPQGYHDKNDPQDEDDIVLQLFPQLTPTHPEAGG